jgi:HAD superfamily hydrolase (TIGR01490 family)
LRVSEIRVAFFDVDETLIKVKSMFSFLERLLAEQGFDPEERAYVVGRFHRLASSGASRSEVNRAYYRSFRGYSRTWLLEAGREWFLEATTRTELFNAPVLQELEAHRRNGAHVVLVSGSFEACLTPVAERVGAARSLCTTPSKRGDVYTGEVGTPMIGEQKRTAAGDLLAEMGVPAAEAIAYGDHLSDAPLLEAAGHAVVVGDDAEMVQLATERGWRVLALPTT